MAIEHNVIPDGERHEPKGLLTAQNGQVYIARGADSGEWVYLPMGWGNYDDNGAAQVCGTSPTKLSIDGAGSGTNESYLPREIRGSGSLWDTVNDVITPIRIGDSYTVRINLPVTAKSGTPGTIDLELDIGGAATPTIVVAARTISVSNTPPYTISAAFPIFTLGTFLANGGQIFVTSASGSVTITNPSILIDMNTGGDI